ncbi:MULTISPECIES: YtxH domain-containing protein [unclassified Paenibacillus]|uniref:YtxH domain-containing protein n=1 Tax=unclassified Paenibacillus TaxID=185978 RepID=UPI001E41D966|nr:MULTISPECIES: YtxH domain-containing protein [unclassified Paenibacillus]CAH0117659.1 hypothetical protein PAE9249_00119 [Paenibacillus sp. CECT 9249]
MNDKGKTFMVGALIGGIVGSVTALLFAPKSGRELRKDIKEGAQQVGEKTQQVVKQVSEQTTAWIGKARSKAEDLASRRRGNQEDRSELEVAEVSGVKEEAQERELVLEEVLK